MRNCEQCGTAIAAAATSTICGGCHSKLQNLEASAAAAQADTGSHPRLGSQPESDFEMQHETEFDVGQSSSDSNQPDSIDQADCQWAHVDGEPLPTINYGGTNQNLGSLVLSRFAYGEEESMTRERPSWATAHPYHDRARVWGNEEECKASPVQESYRTSYAPAENEIYDIGFEGAEDINSCVMHEANTVAQANDLTVGLWNVANLGGGTEWPKSRTQQTIDRICMVINQIDPDIFVILEVLDVSRPRNTPATRESTYTTWRNTGKNNNTAIELDKHLRAYLEKKAHSSSDTFNISNASSAELFTEVSRRGLWDKVSSLKTRTNMDMATLLAPQVTDVEGKKDLNNALQVLKNAADDPRIEQVGDIHALKDDPSMSSARHGKGALEIERIRKVISKDYKLLRSWEENGYTGGEGYAIFYKPTRVEPIPPCSYLEGAWQRAPFHACFRDICSNSLLDVLAWHAPSDSADEGRPELRSDSFKRLMNSCHGPWRKASVGVLMADLNIPEKSNGEIISNSLKLPLKDFYTAITQDVRWVTNSMFQHQGTSLRKSALKGTMKNDIEKMMVNGQTSRQKETRIKTTEFANFASTVERFLRGDNYKTNFNSFDKIIPIGASSKNVVVRESVFDLVGYIKAIMLDKTDEEDRNRKGVGEEKNAKRMKLRESKQDDESKNPIGNMSNDVDQNVDFIHVSDARQTGNKRKRGSTEAENCATSVTDLAALTQARLLSDHAPIYVKLRLPFQGETEMVTSEVNSKANFEEPSQAGCKFDWQDHDEDEYEYDNQNDEDMSPIKSEAELPDALKDKFERVKVLGDGNCLFRALAVGCGESENNHADHRLAAVNYARSNPNKFPIENINDPEFPEFNYRDLDEYYTVMKDPAVDVRDHRRWGGQVEIEAWALLRDKTVVIHTLSILPRVFNPDATNTVNLFWANENHYDYLDPRS